MNNTSKPVTATEVASSSETASGGTANIIKRKQSWSRGTNCHLVCPMCSRMNGFWLVHFKELFESSQTIYHRKRCGKCKTRVLYKAHRTPDGVAVNSFIDLKAQQDIAQHFGVSVQEVRDALAEAVLEQKEKEDAQRKMLPPEAA